MGKQQKEGSSLVNFSKAGWGTIIFCIAMFWFFVEFCTDGIIYRSAVQNILVFI